MGRVTHLNPAGAARYFVLDADRRPIQVSEAQWRAQRRSGSVVAEDDVPHGRVWTAFSGIAVSDGDERKLFATQSLIGEDGLDEATYATWDEAEAGHRQIVDCYRSKFGARKVVPLPEGDQ